MVCRPSRSVKESVQGKGSNACFHRPYETTATPAADLHVLGDRDRARHAVAWPSTVGTGPLPDEADADWVTLDIKACDMVEEARGFERAIADLPIHVVDALDRFDPDGSAPTYVGAVQVATSGAGRPAYGARRPEWVALEDKVVIDRFFDEVGVPHPPSVVVRAQRDNLLAASSELAGEHGSVWSGDSSDGFNGGTVLVRWVRDGDDAEDAARFLGRRCRRVRIAPFIEGIPCSIHGMVFDDGVVVFRPVELVTLRRSDRNEIRYAGCATFWDPAESDRVAMRGMARRLGNGLRTHVAYRGAFTLDGIMSEGGFVATELNPRFGAGLNILAASLPELPLLLLHHAVVAGEPWELRPDEFEELVVEAADRQRGGGGWITITQPCHETEEHLLVNAGAGYRPLRAREEATARLSIGPSTVGGFVRFEPNPKQTPVGPSLAPRVAAAFRVADRVAGTEIGPLSPAQDVRAG